MLTEIVVLIILILLNAFFAASEIALISLNDNKIRVMAESGDKKAKLLHNLLSEPSSFLATIQIGITLAGFLASAFAAESFSGRLAHVLYDLGTPISKDVLEKISVIIITIVLSYFTLVLGELVPKRLALQKSEEISTFSAVPLTFLSKVTSPFVKLLTFSTNVIVRMFGVDPNAEEADVTEEEIRLMIDVGKERGTILETEKEMINNIFEFDNKTVSEIMTHRTNIAAIPIQYNLKEIVQLANQERYTRFPVYDESIDNVVGILHVKDLIQYVESPTKHSFDLKEMIREPHFVLESRRTDDLFKDMQENNIHMAIVLDEYGGTDGIVTIEDLIEEIVGNIFDEYDEPELDEEEIITLDDTAYMVVGTLNLHEFEEFFNIKLPTEEYDTLSGFIIGQLGHIPMGDEKPILEYENLKFIVEEINDKRIVKVKIIVNEKVEEELRIK